MTNKSFSQFVSPVPAAVSIARHSFPPNSSVRTLSACRFPATPSGVRITGVMCGCVMRVHHAGASRGCIVRMSCPRVWVRIMRARARPRPQEKNFFEKTAPASNTFSGFKK